MYLTHWGRVTHICGGNLTIIGLDNGLSPGRRPAIIWTNAGILSIRTLGTTFDEIFSKIHAFSFKKMHMKMSSGKMSAILCRPQCVNVSNETELNPLWCLYLTIFRITGNVLWIQQFCKVLLFMWCRLCHLIDITVDYILISYSRVCVCICCFISTPSSKSPIICYICVYVCTYIYSYVI